MDNETNESAGERTLNDIVGAAVSNIVTSGKVEEMIEAAVTKAVGDAIDTSFRSFGGAGKQIREGFEKGLAFDFSKVDMDAYNIQILDMVKISSAKYMQGEAQAKMLEIMESLFKPAPETVTVDEIVELYMAEWKDDDCYCGDEYASAEWEKSEYSWWDLKLWKGSKTKHSSFSSPRDVEPDLRISVHSDGMLGIPRSFKEQLGLGNFGADSKLYQMYAAGTRVVGHESFDIDTLDLSLTRDGY